MEQTKLERLMLEEISAVGWEYGGGPANQLDGFMVSKARRRKTLLATAERLRKACGGDDELFVAVVRGEAIPWNGVKSQGVLKAVRPRNHDGRFAREGDPITTNVDGLIFRHSGAVHPGLRALAAPWRKPTADHFD